MISACKQRFVSLYQFPWGLFFSIIVQPSFLVFEEGFSIIFAKESHQEHGASFISPRWGIFKWIYPTERMAAIIESWALMLLDFWVVVKSVLVIYAGLCL